MKKNGYKAAVITVLTGPLEVKRRYWWATLVRLLEELGFEVVDKALVPDEIPDIKES